MNSSKPLLLALAAGVSAATLPAPAQLVYDEAVDGDLSDVMSSPTSFGVLAPGLNSLKATSGGGDLEYVTFTIPNGLSLGSMILAEYDSLDDTAFVAIQSGTTFTVAPGDAPANVGALLGWTHFGSGGSAGTALVGTDILDNLGAGAGAQGFAPPLGPGDYTLWIQQAGGSSTTYQFDLVAVPEPEHAAMAFGALLVGAAAHRRWRRA